MPNFGRKVSLVDTLDSLRSYESELIIEIEEFPGEWLFSEEIRKLFDKIGDSLSGLEKLFNSLDSDSRYKLFKVLSSKFIKIEVRIKRLIYDIKKNLSFIKRTNNKELNRRTLESMKYLINSIHEFSLLSKSFPIYKIRDNAILDDLFKSLRRKRLNVPDINYLEAKEMIKKVSDDELILVLQYESNNSPYLFITKNRYGEICRLIVKKEITNQSSKRSTFIISKLMGELKIPSFGIQYRVMAKEEGLFQHTEYINFLPGRKIFELESLKNLDSLLSYSYLLGASFADSFIFNLKDRLVNVHIDFQKFEKIKFNSKHKFLGENNPIYHIDLEFPEKSDVPSYFQCQLFSNNGLLVDLLYQKSNLVFSQYPERTKELRSTIVENFMYGFRCEMSRILGEYQSKKEYFNRTYESNAIGHLLERFKNENYLILKKMGKEFIENSPIN